MPAVPGVTWARCKRNRNGEPFMPTTPATQVNGRGRGRIRDRSVAARWPRRGRLVAARPVRRAGVALGLAGCLLGGAAVAPSGLGAAALAAGHSAGWRIVPSPNGSAAADNALVQVSAGPGGSAWAVGYDGYNGQFRTMIQRWNGARWTVVRSPSVGPLDNTLSGVATQSATDAWAAGYYSVAVGLFAFHRALIEHWNGSAWQVTPTPLAGKRDSDLSGVTALSATNAWAVGNVNVGTCANPARCFQFAPLVEHWNGSAWTQVKVPAPPPAGYGASLFGVAATSPHNIWAVGNYDTGKRFQPLIEHFNGTRWALVPAPAAGSAILNRISMSTPTNGWAVGVTGASYPGHTQAQAEHWNGHHWTQVSTPAIKASSLAGVLTLSPHLAWAVGSAAAPHGDTRTLTERWNGHTWAIAPSPNRPPASDLIGIAGTPQHLWAVGSALTNTLILRH